MKALSRRHAGRSSQESREESFCSRACSALIAADRRLEEREGRRLRTVDEDEEEGC